MAEDMTPGESAPLVSGADIRTFLFADMRGYTRFTQEHGDDAASELAGQFADLVNETVPGFEGELLELRGDEALCVFRSARQALRASVELQRRLRTGSEERAAFPIGVGMGLDAGEAVPTHGGYRGAALNRAARLCALAKPGQILATESVAHLATRVEGLRLVGGRAVRVKGVAQPLGIVEVIPDLALPEVPTLPRVRRSATRWVIVAAAIIAVVALAVVIAVTRGSDASRSETGVTVNADSLVAIDAKTGRLVHDVRLGSVPGAITGGAGGVWVGIETTQSVSRVDTSRYRVGVPIGLGIDPAQMTVAFNSLWVYDAVGNRLAVVDPTGRTSPLFLRVLPPCPRISTLGNRRICGVGGITADAHGVWLGRSCPSACVASDMGWIWHLSPTAPYHHSNAIRGAPADRLALGAGRLWAYGANGFWAAYLASTGKLVRYQIPNVAGVYNQPGLTVGYGATWVVAPSGTLFEYTTSGYQRSVPIPKGSYEVAAGDNWLWVLGSDGTVTKINPYTFAHAHTYHLQHDGEGITFYKGRVWVSVGAATPR